MPLSSLYQLIVALLHCGTALYLFMLYHSKWSKFDILLLWRANIWGTHRANNKAQAISAGVGSGMEIGRRAPQRAVDSQVPYRGGGFEIRGWKPRAVVKNKKTCAHV